MRLKTFSSIALGLFFASSVTAAPAAADPDRRAAEVEVQLTDAERISLLHGVMPFAIPGIGIDPERIKGLPAVAGHVPGVPRLGIPALLETDASLGVANPLQMRADQATALPSGLSMASSFNPQLAFAAGALIGREARSFGYNVLLGGGANLARDPRNGRNFEYLGEDPLLAGVMAGEAIRGTQSEGVVSTVKHFSLNAQETQRHTLDARIDEAAHRESDLLAFQLAIERGQPGSVMCAYNRVNGPYACGSDHLLNTVLKRDWGYKGWVMSDWGAVHDVAYFNAGLDQQSGAQLDPQVFFDQPLKAEVAAGRVSRARVSDAVRRILRSVYAVGADRPMPPAPIDFAAHDPIVREAAAQGMVLLSNDGVLPLKAGLRSVLVVGGQAHVGVLSGAGSSQVTPVGGPAALIPVGGPGMMTTFGRQLYLPSSPLKALQTALGSGVAVDYDSGYDLPSAAARAAQAELVIVFATQWQTESMDAGMALPQGQDELIAAVAKANRNTLVVLQTGNPVRMPWAGQVRAVLQAWYPGSQGGEAIADVLTGVREPGGRLPLTWPMDESQNPRPVIPGLGLPERTPVVVDYSEGSDVGYRWFAARGLAPRHAFGHGLGYTSFTYEGLQLQAGKATTATFTVRNTGAREGATVPQLYLTHAAGRRLQRLAAFERVSLKPGESRQVTVTLEPRLLAEFDAVKNGWHIEAGQYEFALGASASDLRERVSVKLAARRMKP